MDHTIGNGFKGPHDCFTNIKYKYMGEEEMRREIRDHDNAVWRAWQNENKRHAEIVKHNRAIMDARDHSKNIIKHIMDMNASLKCLPDSYWRDNYMSCPY